MSKQEIEVMDVIDIEAVVQGIGPLKIETIA
jgi:hypothetical protein